MFFCLNTFGLNDAYEEANKVKAIKAILILFFIFKFFVKVEIRF